MWTRDVAGLTSIALVALYVSFHLLPATGIAGGAFRQIVSEQRTFVDQLDQLDRARQSRRTDAQASTEAGRADWAPLVRDGPNQLDGMAWGPPGGG